MKCLYTMQCRATGETQEVVVCQVHADDMPAVDGDRIRVTIAEPDVACELCTFTSKGVTYCRDCGNPGCPNADPADPFWSRCPATDRVHR